MFSTAIFILYIILMMTLSFHERGNSYPITTRGLIIQFCIWMFIYFAGYQAGQINYFSLDPPKESTQEEKEELQEFLGNWQDVKTNR